MQCYTCKHEFCWMCLGDWKAHGSEYYECSRYKENPNIAHESVHAQAREALKKYLHYYERVRTKNFIIILPLIYLHSFNQFLIFTKLEYFFSVGESQQIFEIRTTDFRRHKNAY